MIFIKKSGSLFFNNHFLQAHLPAYVVPSKKKHTINAVPNTCNKFLFDNTGKKKNETKARQNKLCAAILERNNLFIKRCKVSIYTNVARTWTGWNIPVRKKSNVCRMREKGCLSIGQGISGFCKLFIQVGRIYFQTKRTRVKFVCNNATEKHSLFPYSACSVLIQCASYDMQIKIEW